MTYSWAKVSFKSSYKRRRSTERTLKNSILSTSGCLSRSKSLRMPTLSSKRRRKSWRKRRDRPKRETRSWPRRSRKRRTIIKRG